jgi:hypothetical protein
VDHDAGPPWRTTFTPEPLPLPPADVVNVATLDHLCRMTRHGPCGVPSDAFMTAAQIRDPAVGLSLAHPCHLFTTRAMRVPSAHVEVP